jgi:hypothetical protein
MMAKWFWYIGKENELLIDLDSELRLWNWKEKMRRNVVRGFLKVENVYLARSVSPGHYHVIVTLAEPMEPLRRLLWECELQSDLQRMKYSWMRLLQGLDAPDLLIADRPYPNFRPPDYECFCAEKHKPRRITKHCPILRLLHGDQAGAEYFAIRRDRIKRDKPLRLPIGNVPLNKITNS